MSIDNRYFMIFYDIFFKLSDHPTSCSLQVCYSKCMDYEADDTSHVRSYLSVHVVLCRVRRVNKLAQLLLLLS